MKRVTKARLADGLLRVLVLGSVTSAALIAPNGLQLLDKPLQKFIASLDEKERKRKIAEALAYLRYRGLVQDDYQHGLRLTKKAEHRLQQQEVEAICITPAKRWDGVWRIVFFDIPEPMKTKRDQFAARLKHLGFGVLQRSVFICPHPCRDEVVQLARYYAVDQYTTYIETSYIDNDTPLKEHFEL